MLLWPNTSKKIYAINNLAYFPNGAYEELINEMNHWGLTLKIYDTVTKQAAKDLPWPIPLIDIAEPGDTLTSMIEKVKGRKKSQNHVLYWVSSPYIIYAGEAKDRNVHIGGNYNDIVQAYNNLRGDHPPYEIIPIGSIEETESRKFEAHLHVAAQFASFLKLHNCINPGSYSSSASHPLCINMQTNVNHFDENSLKVINEIMKKQFRVEIFLGKQDNKQDE